MPRPSVRIARPPLALALSALLAACATPQERIASREDGLVMAGFVARPADTPQRAAMLERLPANRFALGDANGRPVYLYGDPLVCGCLFVGTDRAYALYGERLFRQRLADEQLLAAQVRPVPAWSLDDWGGPWGPRR